MFGLLYFACACVGRSIEKLRLAIRNEQIKQESYNSSDNIYHDSNYQYYDGTTNQKIYAEDIDSRRVYKNYKGEIVKDPQQEKLYVEYKRLKEHPEEGITVARWTLPHHYTYDEIHSKVVGVQYKDLENGKLYVRRSFIEESSKAAKKYGYGSPEVLEYGACNYYMDIETGFLVRPVDGETNKTQLLKNSKWFYKLSSKEQDEYIIDLKERSQKFIDKFNEEQKKRKAEGFFDNRDFAGYYRNYNTEYLF